MAKRRGGRGSVYRRGGSYKFTSKRQYALKRAQAISARKRRIKVGIMVGSGVAGLAGAAYLGHRHGGTAVAAVRNFKPKQAEPDRPFTAARLSEARRAVQPKVKETTRTVIAQVSGTGPNVIAANKANVDKPQRAYNVDRFLPKQLVFGRKLKQSTAKSAIAKHAESKSSMTKEPVDQNEILNAMIADGTVRKRATSGRRVSPKRPKKKQTVAEKAQAIKNRSLDQWIKDFG